MRLEDTDFDVRETIGDTLRAMAVHAREKRLELMYEVNPGVPSRLVGTRTAMSQILVNLVRERYQVHGAWGNRGPRQRKSGR